MGNAQSAASESFAGGLLEYPQYTRPQVWEGRAIPEVLTSGDHGRIAEWRRAEAIRITRERRPDLDPHGAAPIDKPGRLEYGTARFHRPGRGLMRASARLRPTGKKGPVMNILQEIEKEQIAAIAGDRTIPDFAPGDTVRVNVKVTEGTRTRVQAYEGVCIARAGGGLNENFTVRKISYGEGVERVFPIYSPSIDSIEVVRRGKVRRAKLYYLRGRRGKSARIAEKQDYRTRTAEIEAVLVAAPAEAKKD